MNELNYKIIYRNGDRIPHEIALLSRKEDGKFIFKYLEDAKYEFPGFPLTKKTYENDTLWEQISFRIPNVLRKQHPNTPAEELLKETEGKLVTDHFEFQPL
jgi:hypothetical protein